MKCIFITRFFIPEVSLLTFLKVNFEYLFYGLHTAVKFIRDTPEGMYDAIIVDSSDPIGLFHVSFIHSYRGFFNLNHARGCIWRTHMTLCCVLDNVFGT